MTNILLPVDGPVAPSECKLYHGDCLDVMPFLAPFIGPLLVWQVVSHFWNCCFYALLLDLDAG